MPEEGERCVRLQQALIECHRRMAAGPVREAGCRHLNRALAECLLTEACPAELDLVRSLCSSAGTALKRSQCSQAQLSLSIVLSQSLKEIVRVKYRDANLSDKLSVSSLPV